MAMANKTIFSAEEMPSFLEFSFPSSSIMRDNYLQKKKLDQVLTKECRKALDSTSTVADSDSRSSGFSSVEDFAAYSGSLVKSALSGEVPVEIAIQKLKIHLEANPGLGPVLAEQLQIIIYWIEGESETGSECFTEFLSQLFSQNVIPAGELRERIEQELLQTVGSSEKNTLWDTRYVRMKTKWFFKLLKFNLYREESEGFAELVNLADHIGDTPSQIVIEKIMELAGRYDLDIYRIVETILTAACVMPHALSPLLLSFCDSIDFDTNVLVAMLNNKFQLYGQKSSKDYRRLRGVTIVACYMVSAGLTSWDDIIPNVPLSKPDAQQQWKAMFDRCEAEDQQRHTRSRAVKEQTMAGSANLDDLAIYFEDIRNPRIEVITVMLQHGMYHNALRLINIYPAHYATTFQPIAMEIAKIVNYIIDPIYQRIGFDSLRNLSTSSEMPAVINEQLPLQMESIFDIEEKLEPWLLLLGSNLMYDRRLFTKLLRIFEEFVVRHQDTICRSISALGAQDRTTFGMILHFMEHCFLPALMRGTGTTAISEAAFNILKLLPYNIRYTLYNKIKEDFSHYGHPFGIVSRCVAHVNAKWFQRRVNKDNIKYCGKAIGKDLTNNPYNVCSHLTERIVSYDNLGNLVTDSIKNCSLFVADVMLYSVLEYLSRPGTVKYDKTNVLPSYRGLASFCATFAKKHTVEVEPIVDYVVAMVKNGSTVDLLVLRELVHKLSGIELSEEVTNEQLEALAGGDVLKSEGAYFNPMRSTKRSSNRLKEALLKSNQALPLCLLISHVESDTLYRDVGTNFKLLGLLYDMCHDVLVQYGTFLATNLSKKEYAENFPSLAELIQTYKMPFETSIFLIRSIYWNEIMTKLEDFKSQRGIPSGTLNETDFKLVQDRFSEIFDDVITKVVELITPVMNHAPMEDISLRFYVLYWFLSLYDLYVPVGVYEQEIEKFKEIIEAPIEEQGEDREAILTVIKRKKEKERGIVVIGRLKEEMGVQKQHVEMLRNHLSDEKDKWFQTAKSTKSDVVSQFLQMCVLPRSTFSTIDALFSAHFISCLHDLKTTNFSTLLCYDRMLCDITTALTCCSENEASRYGRLLHAILKSIKRWHGNKTVFDEECHHHPGFVTKFRATTAGTAPGNTVDHIDYENFRHVCHKWHYKLTKSMVACLQADSYVRIRNGLIVLDRILPFYPVVNNFYLALDKEVGRLVETEKTKRPDLYTLAYGYKGRLRSQKALLIPENKFHIKLSKKGEEKDGEKKDGEGAVVNGMGNTGESQAETGTALGSIVPDGPKRPTSAPKESVSDTDKKSTIKRPESKPKKAEVSQGLPEAAILPAKPDNLKTVFPKVRLSETELFDDKPAKKALMTKAMTRGAETVKSKSASQKRSPPTKRSKPAPQNGTVSGTPTPFSSPPPSDETMKRIVIEDPITPDRNDHAESSPSSIISDIADQIPLRSTSTAQNNSSSSRTKEKEWPKSSHSAREHAQSLLKSSSNNSAGLEMEKSTYVKKQSKNVKESSRKRSSDGSDLEKTRKERKLPQELSSIDYKEKKGKVLSKNGVSPATELEKRGAIIPVSPASSPRIPKIVTEIKTKQLPERPAVTSSHVKVKERPQSVTSSEPSGKVLDDERTRDLKSSPLPQKSVQYVEKPRAKERLPIEMMSVSSKTGEKDSNNRNSMHFSRETSKETDQKSAARLSSKRRREDDSSDRERSQYLHRRSAAP